MRTPRFVINVPHSSGLPWDRIWACVMKSRWMNARVLTWWNAYTKCNSSLALTLILLTWRIWWAPNNASKWQMGFNSAFKGLNHVIGSRFSVHECYLLWLQVITDNREQFKRVFPLLTLQKTRSLFTSDTWFTLDCSAVGRIRWKLSACKVKKVLRFKIVPSKSTP